MTVGMRLSPRMGFVSVILLLAMVSSMGAQDAKPKKFLKKPLTIEDQGSFFIGGVTKVTNYAGGFGPANANTPPAPNQITIGQMYVQFQIPARRRPGRPSSWSTVQPTREPRLNPRPTAAKAGLRTSFAKVYRRMSSIRRAAAVRDSINPSFEKRWRPSQPVMSRRDSP